MNDLVTDLTRHPYWVLSAASIILLVVAIRRRFGTQAAIRASGEAEGLILAGIGTVGLCCVAMIRVIQLQRWGYVLAIVPALIIGRHAIYLRLTRRRAFFEQISRPGVSTTEEVRRLGSVFAEARVAHDREFSPDLLTVRYGVPALFVVLIGIASFHFLGDGEIFANFSLPEQSLRGARFAAMGAYVYVLLYLGQRAVRRDLTSGAALWSGVILTLGPVLGAVLALLWKGTTAKGSVDAMQWSYDAIYFVAGLAPRHAAAVVEEAVRRLWLTRSAQPTETRRAVPSLSQVRGLGVETEERLAEEGITDLEALAMADPLKLYRNTAFDKRLILSWMDEALLIINAPACWTELELVGITGAMDLAVCHARFAENAAVFTDLCSVAKLDLTMAPAIARIAQNLFEDKQVNLIWALYQMDEETDASETGELRLSRTPAVRSSTPELVGSEMLLGLVAVLAVVAYCLADRTLPSWLLKFAALFGCAGFLLSYAGRPLTAGTKMNVRHIAACVAGAAMGAFAMFRYTSILSQSEIKVGHIIVGALALIAGGYLERRRYLSTSVKLELKFPEVVSPGSLQAYFDDVPLDLKREPREYTVRRVLGLLVIKGRGWYDNTRYIDMRFGDVISVSAVMTTRMVQVYTPVLSSFITSTSIEGPGASVVAAGPEFCPRIYIDDKLQTGNRFELLPGTYSFRFEADDHYPKKWLLTVNDTESFFRLDVALDVQRAKVVIDLDPAGISGTVKVDGLTSHSTGTTIELSPGSHDFRVMSDGFAPSQFQVNVGPGEHVSKTIALVKTPAVVEADPSKH